jgi:hypothetical protein
MHKPTAPEELERREEGRDEGRKEGRKEAGQGESEIKYMERG